MKKTRMQSHEIDHAAAGKPIATFTVEDHLDHRWTDELVGFDIAKLPGDQTLSVRDDQGALQPCQVRREEQRTRVCFVVKDLPPLSRKTFELLPVAPPSGAQAPWSRVEGGGVELGNGLISVRVPAACERPSPIPAPVQSVRRGAGPWIGEGRVHWSTALTLIRVESALVESGPLWLAWRVRYVCEKDADYTVTIRLYAGRSEAELTEASTLCRASCWEFSVRPGLSPTHGWTHPHQVSPRQPPRLRPIDFANARERTNLGSIQLPVYSGIWIPDDYYYFAFLNEAGTRDCVAAAGVNGGFWDYPYENQIDVATAPDGDAFFRLSIKAGHRRWLLLVADRDEVTKAEPFFGSPIHAAIKRYETPLDKVKDWVLAWENLPQDARPFAMATREQLKHAQKNARSFKPLRDYVAALNPDLPGDYTYYHSGTHRTFEGDYRNDPAVLYVTADSDEERTKQARFLKDVVLTGLKDRREGMLDHVGHCDSESASINLGRGLRPWAALYDFAAAEGVFSEEEDRLARASFAFFCYKIFDPDYWPADHLVFRDDHPVSAHRTHWFPNRQSDWCFYNIDNLPHNFHGDLWSAAGCVAMALPNHPMSRRWVDRTIEWWECELTYWVFPEGAWLESACYTLNSMKDYILYCRMLANSGIRDYFTDERLQRAFRYIADTLTPPNPRLNGACSMPVLGDASYPNGYGYVFGWMAGLARHDRAFSRLMSFAWKQTGYYLVEPGRWGLNCCDFLFLEPSIPGAPPKKQESKWYHGIGPVLRYGHGTPAEINIPIKAGIIYSHFHEPEGTFQLWWNRVPVCDEYGVQYGHGLTEPKRFVWDPEQHNCIAIDVAGQTPYNKGDLSAFVATDAFDYTVAEAPIQPLYLRENESCWGFRGEAGPAGWHRRCFFFVKPHYLYIYDDLAHCPYATRYHLNVKADGKEQKGGHVHYNGRLGVDLEFLLLQAGERAFTHGEFDVEPHKYGFQPPPRFYHQLQMAIAGRPHESFATVLAPHKPKARVRLEDDAATGGARIALGKISDRALLFPDPREVAGRDLVYTGQAGVVRTEGGALTLLQARGTRIGVPGRLCVDGDGPFAARCAARGPTEIATDGIARWLVFSDRPFAAALCDGRRVKLEALAGGRQRVYVPAGRHCLTLR